MELDFEKKLTDIEKKIAELTELNSDPNAQFDTEIGELSRKANAAKKKIYQSLSPWQTVQVARHADRPLLRDYITGIFSDFVELHGDRCFGDDRGIIGGFATINEHKVMLIGHQKGKTVEENIENNFGMATPDGYRKALRLMKLAEKYGIPVLAFIDTPGAYPGLDAEARGQAEAIARNLTEMATLKVPIVVVVSGEGGSGGALGIGVGDIVIMLSNSVYSVISPEGCASILWKDEKRASEAADALKVTAESLLKLKIIDEIVEEPLGGAHRDYDSVFKSLSKCITKHLEKLQRLSTRKLVDRRFEKYARMGRFEKRKTR